ncbi:nucleotidyltransferase family protein [Noviherbaspirillum galbum]|uniref:Nucleotidyltransferase family protein n=1 Tax=Noviherbaspirillum galbum TaxID=2709383 RepID=A0A6B3SS22_9BURK|nr:nucleotidyltransferase family protein [Noviherbaspirillum galbum]NEX61242.1 nucleotidyltransferase family protein [Noviherbaspirillum galbum]
MSGMSGQVVGILLAAGRGSRFDPEGARNKLMQPLADGGTVAVRAAAAMLGALPRVLAVVRPGADVLAVALRAAGCEVSCCAEASEGMGASLRHAIGLARDADGWVIALADMPYVQSSTVRLLADAIRGGASIAAPTREGRRGNPVAFHRNHLDALLGLSGDEGARRLLRSHPVMEIAVDDPGIARDIDTVDDLT